MSSIEDQETNVYHKHATIKDPCVQDRPIRDIQRDIRGIHERLNAGDTCMTRLECTLENLTKAVQDTMTTTKELTIALREMSSKAPSLGQKILDAFITWSVPVVAFVVLWALVNSGAINVPLPRQDTQGTHK